MLGRLGKENFLPPCIFSRPLVLRESVFHLYLPGSAVKHKENSFGLPVVCSKVEREELGPGPQKREPSPYSIQDAAVLLGRRYPKHPRIMASQS